VSWVLVAAVYTQLVVGAVMRHLKAGLAIPTFPRSGLNGEWLPPFWNEGVAFHFAHRIGALLIVIILIALGALIFTAARGERRLTTPMHWLGILVVIQISLGAHIILKLRPPTLTTLHVVNGAAVLTTALLLAVRATRLHPAAAEHAPDPVTLEEISV